MHAAAAIFLSVAVLLAIALLLPLGVLIGRRILPPGWGEAPLAPAAIPVRPPPARPRPTALLAAAGHMRAPPTFPAQWNRCWPDPLDRG